MIKRVLGVIFTLLIVATIAFAWLEWGNYSSMVFKRQGKVERVREAVVEQIEESDSLRQAPRPNMKPKTAKKKVKRVAPKPEEQQSQSEERVIINEPV